MTDATVSPAKPEPAGKSVRSPSYPGMALNEAIDSVRKIETEYRTAPVDRVEAAKLIGYSGGSGPANKALADLASYGLVERAGKGELRVSQRAKAILYPDSEDERRLNIREAAFDPQLFRELQERFKDVPHPPESGIVSYLGRIGMNQNAVRPATKAFLKTLDYLEQTGAIESHSTARDKSSESTSSDQGKPTFGGAKIGDLIQWEAGGVLKFETPRRVRQITPDGEWVAVEGSETGIPMSEVIVEERESENAGRASPPQFPIEDAGTMAKRESEYMRTPLSAETKVRLLVEGEMGPRELGKLIKLLEAQKIVFDDD